MTADGELLAETKRPIVLSESGTPNRFFLPREDVEDAKLEASGTRGVCPYKGRASYWSARAGNRLLEDVAVAYHGSGDAAKVAGHVCFVGPGIEVWVDGEPVH